MIEQMIAWLRKEIKIAETDAARTMSISERIEFDAEANALKRALAKAEKLMEVRR